MSKIFYVDQDLCTACGDCWNKLPQHFRDTGADTAEVYNTDLAPENKDLLEQVMADCPGEAILWKKD